METRKSTPQRNEYCPNVHPSVTTLDLVSDLLFSESPGADRTGSLVAIALPQLLLFRTTGKGFCLSRPTPPPASLTWPVYSESFPPVQLYFSRSCPNGHHVTFHLPGPSESAWMTGMHSDVDDTWDMACLMSEL